eukprot:CAMPEP_0195008756 /NCGR_PEP_ID=MMETSP0326_2-20130528/8708_1 /TAXON_ID=2866 ORGANISM="Crypthecodinium cohnii, Strain Seligo" /NCGR_SAMPLE_ID=MMETSP0326_2 /ASSEMBLY_ACC=CAM_ASM_000348 /LENGTH=40 /DNA_ID= /DNA_START= /DNA_END= /DNA_ORIENTATION=
MKVEFTLLAKRATPALADLESVSPGVAVASNAAKQPVKVL